MKLQFKLILLILIIIFTASCSGKRIGYVVMLWPPEEVKAETGEIIKIISQSDIRNVYVIEKKEDKYRAEIPKTSGRFFKKKKEAEIFASRFAEFKDTFGYSEKSIPVRAEPDSSSARVYKLRPSQMIKIIEKEEKEVTVGNLTGFWYKVLTDDGFEGYCFDKYLTLFEIESENLAESSEKDWLNDLYDNRWYPVKYKEIVESGRIIISRIKTGEGLFINPEKKQFVIQTEEDRIEFNYESITRVDERRYFLEGTPVEINFYPNNSINIKYVYEGIDYNSFYTLLDQSVNDYAAAEISRRNSVYQALYEKGGYLSSDLYGSIVLKRNRNFIWTGYVNLVPDIIPSGYGITGTVENHYYLSDRLAKSYDGILSFVFERNSEEINFVYYMTGEEGMELIYLPSDYIEDDLVDELPEIKEIYYFRQGITLEESRGFEDYNRAAEEDSTEGLSSDRGAEGSDDAFSSGSLSEEGSPAADYGSGISGDDMNISPGNIINQPAETINTDASNDSSTGPVPASPEYDTETDTPSAETGGLES